MRRFHRREIGIGDDELHELAMTEPAVTRALNGLEISRVIVRAPKLVNIVAR